MIFCLFRFLLYTVHLFPFPCVGSMNSYRTPYSWRQNQDVISYVSWFEFIEFSLFVIFKHVVKCVNVIYIKLTAVFLVSPVVTVRLAVTVPAFWYTPVQGRATVVL